MYGEPGPDPTNGRVKWHKYDGPKWKEKVLPPLGAHSTRDYDEQYGRWWFQKRDEWRPKMYTSIGKHARSKGLSRTIVRWTGSTPNFKRLKRDVHRKRWPKLDQLSMNFFAEFCHKEFSKRTLLETCHTLPLYGVGCKFWRTKEEDGLDTLGHFFVASTVDFKQRPIRGLVKGTQYMFGRPVRRNIAPVAKTLGSWRYELPADGHPSIFRPPFPAMLSDAASGS